MGDMTETFDDEPKERVGGIAGGPSSGAVVNYELSNMNINSNNNNNNNNDDGALLHPDVGSKRDRELFEMAEKLFALRVDPAYLLNILLIIIFFNYYQLSLIITKVFRNGGILCSNSKHSITTF